MAKGNIDITAQLRPCTVEVPDLDRFLKETDISFWGDCVYKMPKKRVKCLFHCWHPVTGNALVEYEDGTIREVYPSQIRFVDNAMSEYAFPEMEE